MRRSTITWSARDIAFLIAPRINAAGRLEKASWALSLLLEQDEDMTLFHARRLEQLNKERQDIEEEILEDFEKGELTSINNSNEELKLAKQAASNNKLLNRKLDSRETSESSC